VLDQNAILINTSMNPGPEPVTAVDLREWRKLYQIFWIEQKKFYASFDTAIGILQSIVVYPSKARNDIDIVLCQRPANIIEAEWNPDDNFKLLWPNFAILMLEGMKLTLLPCVINYKDFWMKFKVVFTNMQANLFAFTPNSSNQMFQTLLVTPSCKNG
jgi:hypothetical protein